MSRIGKRSITISNKIDTEIIDNTIKIKGPKGELSHTIPDLIEVISCYKDEQQLLIIQTADSSKTAQKLHGLSRTLINNMVIGVSEGFSKALEIQGVGYRAQIDGKKLILNVGYSHPVIINPPEHITIKVENNTKIIVLGINKAMVGQVSAKIRSIRPPEPYKGKGIRYQNEIVKKKMGKAGK